MVSMRLEIGKRDFFWIVPVFIVLTFGFVYAFGGSNPAVMGHSSGEIVVDNAFCNQITGNDCGVAPTGSGVINTVSGSGIFTCDANICQVFCEDNNDLYVLKNGEKGFCTTPISGSKISTKTALQGNYGQGWISATYSIPAFLKASSSSVTFTLSCSVNTNWATYVFGKSGCNYKRSDETSSSSFLDGNGGVIAISPFTSVSKYNTGTDNNFGNFWWPSGSSYAIHTRETVKLSVSASASSKMWTAIKIN